MILGAQIYSEKVINVEALISGFYTGYRVDSHSASTQARKSVVCTEKIGVTAEKWSTSEEITESNQFR